MAFSWQDHCARGSAGRGSSVLSSPPSPSPSPLFMVERRREGHPGVDYRDAALLVGNGEEAAVVVDLENRERGWGGEGEV